MGRNYYIDPITGDKVYIKTKVPGLDSYRKAADQDEIDKTKVGWADMPFRNIDGNTLVSENGTLKVNVVDEAEEDNTLPISSSGVMTIVGNIGVLLTTI